MHVVVTGAGGFIGGMPPLDAGESDAVGFRHDGSAGELVRRALAPD